MSARLTLAAALALHLATPLGAHPGGLAADGCHREKATGTRHCHGERVVPRHGASTGSAPARDERIGLRGNSASAPFPNCAAARAAGAAPVRRGDPGYAPRLDRDGDGVACE